MLIAVVALIGTILGALITALSATYISKRNHKLQLSLAALDKRFEAHQLAYKMCNMLNSKWTAREIKRNEVQDKFLEFWNDNCLYLGTDSREALSEVFEIYLRFGVDGMGNNIGADFRNARMKTIEALTKEMSLPPLGEKDVSNQSMDPTRTTPVESGKL